jgi:hypothetical protein
VPGGQYDLRRDQGAGAEIGRYARDLHDDEHDSGMSIAIEAAVRDKRRRSGGCGMQCSRPAIASEQTGAEGKNRNRET